VLRGCFRGGFVYVSFCLVSIQSGRKPSKQRCGDIVFDISISKSEAKNRRPCYVSIHFETLIGV